MSLRCEELICLETRFVFRASLARTSGATGNSVQLKCFPRMHMTEWLERFQMQASHTTCPNMLTTVAHSLMHTHVCKARNIKTYMTVRSFNRTSLFGKWGQWSLRCELPPTARARLTRSSEGLQFRCPITKGGEGGSKFFEQPKGYLPPSHLGQCTGS